jgi:hypothetical protein
MKECPRCGFAPLGAEKEFCYKDGMKLVERGITLCICGKQFDSRYDKFCEYCGAPVQKNISG